MVYFMRPRENRDFTINFKIDIRVEYRPIKIGSSNKPSVRLATLRDWYDRKDIELLGVIHGGVLTERFLHGKFSELRIRYKEFTGDDYACEWFRPGDELLRFIREHAKPVDELEQSLATLEIPMQDEFLMMVEQAAFNNGKSIQELVEIMFHQYLDSRYWPAFPFRNHRPIV